MFVPQLDPDERPRSNQRGVNGAIFGAAVADAGGIAGGQLLDAEAQPLVRTTRDRPTPTPIRRR